MPDTTSARQLRIGDAVSFVHRQRTLHGHLLERQGRRRFARVIDAEERIWKVPASALTPIGGPRRTVLLTPFDAERAQWRLGDRVLFDNAGNRTEGEIVKLNPKRAQVRCGNDVWNVPYPMLQRVDAHDRSRDADRLRAVAAMARGCMDRQARSRGLDPRLRRVAAAPRRLPVRRPAHPHCPPSRHRRFQRAHSRHRPARDRPRHCRSGSRSRPALESRRPEHRRHAHGQGVRNRPRMTAGPPRSRSPIPARRRPAMRRHERGRRARSKPAGESPAPPMSPGSPLDLDSFSTYLQRG